jgi:hypothetical protein
MDPKDDRNKRHYIGWYCSVVSYMKALNVSEKQYFLANGSQANISCGCTENISSVATYVFLHAKKILYRLLLICNLMQSMKKICLRQSTAAH